MFILKVAAVPSRKLGRKEHKNQEPGSFLMECTLSFQYASKRQLLLSSACSQCKHSSQVHVVKQFRTRASGLPERLLLTPWPSLEWSVPAMLGVLWLVSPVCVSFAKFPLGQNHGVRKENRNPVFSQRSPGGRPLPMASPEELC